ncbi:MAG TPA: DUF3106 domain-containing protein [Steroidobacteraceae bacterium]|nr:DUF3106 domain-containing protein [Steroidobacteraceae bacterium]
MKRFPAGLLCALLCLAGLASVARAADSSGAAPDIAAPAGTPAAPLAWNALSPAQQDLLKRHSGDWDSLPPQRQRALAHGAERWLGMDTEQRAQARERFQTWQGLPEERRELIRRRWERFQQLDPEAQDLIRQNYRAFAHLPPWKRQQLRRRWLEATPAERARMLDRMRERRGRREPR